MEIAINVEPRGLTLLPVELQATYEIYKPTGTITFILTDSKTIVKTNHQVFLIKHDHRNYLKQLERLRDLIRCNQMKSLSDLITYCNLRPGDQFQMKGLELIPTKLERHI